MATKSQQKQRTWILLAAVLLISFLVALSQHYGLTGRAIQIDKPDLRFINTHDFEVDIDRAARVSVQIYNDGAGFDAPYIVRFEKQTGQNFTWLSDYTVLPPHEHGTAVTANTFFWGSENGTVYTIRATIDPDNNITESDKT